MVDTATDLLQKMIEIYSPSGEEAKISDHIKNTMQEFGYKVSVDKVGNVIGKIGSGIPTILLCGHMDTVPIPLETMTEKGNIYGRGAVDAKASLASMIMTGKLLREMDFGGTLIVAAVVQEEGDNRGVKSLIEADIKSDYAIFGEPTNGTTLSIGYKGCLILEIKSSTTSGHSSASWIYPNAIDETIKIYSHIKESLIKLTEAQTGFDALTVTIREISGGKNIGVVPGICKAVVELRIPPSLSVKLLKEKISKTMDEYNETNKNAAIEINYLDEVNPILTNKNNLLVKAFSRIIFDQQKKPVTLLKKSGASDMNYYGKAYDVPIVTFGPGDPHLSHTNNEYITIKNYIESIEILKNVIIYLEKYHKKNDL